MLPLRYAHLWVLSMMYRYILGANLQAVAFLEKYTIRLRLDLRVCPKDASMDLKRQAIHERQLQQVEWYQILLTQTVGGSLLINIYE